MTTETLKRANEITKQITYYKNLVIDMHHTRKDMFCICGKHTLMINADSVRREILDDDQELWDLLVNYFEDRKSRLEAELKELR